ncbi:NUDIX domain-containing protein [Sphingosinicella sp. BN140058]|uniref:NUDIX domain-containing protein n=1 Tax=Sphingosinicella sp. BN140058 TaxID=1892855 RepID=UPI0010128FD4|nr:NUDIX domain-containing protein [Sphingosinicella sp. BN140058]QAY77471.1 NUDIX domain-containing protein [Sphingosinicella sp. BN140058]
MWRFLIRVAVTTFQRARTAIWFVTRPEALGVHAVVLTPAGRIVLVRQTYSPGWRLPGGGLKLREAPETAIVRELREELRLADYADIRHICNFEHRPEYRRGLAALFLVERAVYDGRPSLEIEAFGEFAPDALPPEATRLTRLLIAAATAGGGWQEAESGAAADEIGDAFVRLLPPDLAAFPGG